MSLYPLFFEFEHPKRRQLFNQHFDFGLNPLDYLTVVTVPSIRRKNCHLWNDRQATQDDNSTIKEEKDIFQVNLDVQHFAPEEISVKTVDGHLIVDAKHEEKQDGHGFVSRSFTRKYKLPEGFDPDSVLSKLSSDGVLSITAPLKPPIPAANERVVPIARTGPVKKEIGDKIEEEQL